ncbi:RED-like protein N-terminal region-domain-containing protein [Gongronella butleri]|nr:RED-like protein N-terminal region-domain-containing protein [Gongronella butleri]
MNDDGLTQDDFRKLLQTPRPQRGDDGDDDAGASGKAQRFKMPAPKAKRNEGTPVFGKPASLRKKKRESAEDDEESSNNKGSAYRDRAAERRAGGDEGGEDGDTAETLLRPMDAAEALDAQQLYEQSKYLGGDVEHTHLVKGLDYALLNKVRQQMSEKRDDESDDDESNDDDDDDRMLDNALDQLESGEAQQEAEAMVIDDESKTAKALHQLFEMSLSSSGRQQPQQQNALFLPGRMAFMFPVLDVNEDKKGNRRLQQYTGDPFAILTSVIRSKAELDQRQASMELNGWSEQSKNEALMICTKISQIMAKKPTKASVTAAHAHVPPHTHTEATTTTASVASSIAAADANDDDDDDDIFGNVGSNYTLDVSSIAQKAAPAATKGHYFMDAQDRDEMEAMSTSVKTDAREDDDDEKMRQVEDDGANEEEHAQLGGARDDKRKRRFDDMVETMDDEDQGMDVDSNDIDMFGLGSGALPTSFKDRQRMVVLDDDEEGASASKKPTTLLIDQGTHKNKRAQLARWDFDTEEEWQQYKSTIEIQPKSAAQFGVKAADGRKRNRERRVMTDKQKLNRDYQQVKSMMDKKYGPS